MVTVRRVIAIAPKHSYTSSQFGSVYLYEREETYAVVYNPELSEFGMYLVSFTRDFGEAAHAYQAVKEQLAELSELLSIVVVGTRKKLVSCMDNWLVNNVGECAIARTSNNVDTFAENMIKNLTTLTKECGYEVKQDD